MAQEPSTEVPEVSRRRLLKTASTVALVGLQSALEGPTGTAPASTLSLPSAVMGPRPMKKVRICVVGGGFGRSFYWSEHPDCEVTAVSELRDDRRKLLVERYHCNKTYGDFHEMLGDPNVDALARFPPAPQHVAVWGNVLTAGKPVVWAVPAAFTWNSA